MYRCINFAKGRIIFDCEDLYINSGNRLLLNFIPPLRTNSDTSVDKKKHIIGCWWQKNVVIKYSQETSSFLLRRL